MEHGTMLMAFALSAFVVLVSGDGYGGGSSVVSVPGGGKGKWRIKAKGKGMQNLISHHSGGDDHHYEHKGHEHKEHKVVYYPVPIHHEGYKKDEYKGYGSHNHEVSVIPLFDQHGGGYHRRYGSSPYELGDYTNYGAKHNHYGGGYY